MLGGRRPSGLKINVMRKGACSRNAAKGTQFKLGMRPGVVMQMGRHSRHGGGTELQGKGHAVRRHEAGGNVRTKQEQGQQEDTGP